MGAKYLEAFGDSKLVSTYSKVYEVLQEDLVSYHQVALDLADRFNGFYINHVLCLENTYAYALAALAATLALPAQSNQHIFNSCCDLYYPWFALRPMRVAKITLSLRSILP